MDIATILTLVEFAIEEEPKVVQSLKNVLSKPEPTSADWEAERAAVANMDYDKIVTNSQLPPENPA